MLQAEADLIKIQGDKVEIDLILRQGTRKDFTEGKVKRNIEILRSYYSHRPLGISKIISRGAIRG